MEWFEPIIIVVAIFLVLLPLILKIKNKKQGKTGCEHECSICSSHDQCLSNLRKYLDEQNNKKESKK